MVVPCQEVFLWTLQISIYSGIFYCVGILRLFFCCQNIKEWRNQDDYYYKIGTENAFLENNLVSSRQIVWNRRQYGTNRNKRFDILL